MHAKNKSITAKLLTTTAVFAMLTVSAKAVPVALVDGQTYGPADNFAGYELNDSGTTSVAFETIADEYFYIGANGVNSILVDDSSSILNIDLSTTGTRSNSGIVFADDIAFSSSGTININVLNGSAIFQGNVADGVNITAGDTTPTSSNLYFFINNDESMLIESAIDVDSSGNIVDMTVANLGSNANNTITFTKDIGVNNPLNSITIGNAGLGDANQVEFRGQINAGTFYVGEAGGNSQLNIITFNNSSNTIYVNADVVGNDSDTNYFMADYDTNLVFTGEVQGIDSVRLWLDSSLIVENNFTGGNIEINDSGTSIEFSNDSMVDSSSLVSADVHSDNDYNAHITFYQTTYTGDITLSGGNDYIQLINNADIQGNINFGDNDDELYSMQNNNQISGSVDFGAGNDLFSIEDDSMTVSGAMTNLEKVLIRGSGAALVVAHDMQISDELDLQYGATLNIQAGKTFTTETITTNEGKYVFDIASPSSYGYLVVRDGAIDLTNKTLEANITGADNLFSNGNIFKVGDGDTDLIGFDGIAGLVKTAINEGSAMFNVYAMDGSQLSTPQSNNDLYFLFEQEATIEDISEGSNNKQIGAVLDGISGTTNPELADIISNINAGSAGQVNEIVSKLTPEVDTAASSGTQNFVNNTLDVTGQRIASLQRGETSMSAGNNMDGLRPWMQVFGQKANQGERGGRAGYDAGTYGAAFGVDTESLVDNTILGAVFSYGNTNVDSRNANRTDTDINSYQLTGYANYSLNSGSFLKGMAAYAYNDIETTRHDVGGIGLTATGDFDASVYTLRGEGGHDYKFGDARVTPSVMAHYSHYRADSYTEKGAGGAGLNVGSNSLNVFEVGAGIETGWDIKSSEGGRFTPEVRAGYRYDLVGDNVNIASSFTGGGGSFTTQGVDPARGTISLGGGLTYYTPANWELSANYEFEHKSDYTSNSGILRAAYKF